MGTKSKMFRAFVAGQTISDGRKIEPDWIDDIAATFSAENYAPRVNVEHISGFSPEPPFNGYGTVCAVEAKTDAFTIDGKTENRRCLYVQVDANDQLVQLAARDQKPFPSVELTDSYAGTGKVGLIGLAFTDSPASIGTQALHFSRHAPGTHFSVGPDRVTVEFEPKTAEPTSVADAIKSGFAALAARFTGSAEPEKKQQPAPEPKTPANDNAAMAQFATAMGETLAAALAPITAAQTKLQGDFATLQTELAKTEAPGTFHRQPANSGAGMLTDC